MYFLKNVTYKSILKINEMKIEAGKVTCIVGESGSGKTSLLRLLNAMNTPDSGEIYYFEENINNLDPVKLRREVVMLSQTTLIFPGTVEENLQAGLQFSGKKIASHQELITAMEKMQLNKSLHENAENLSGGEKQRLALARILLMKPKAFLLDEPTSALDEQTEMEVLHEFVNEAKKINATVIMVTHSKKAEEVAEKIIVLKPLKNHKEGNSYGE
jgi:putative ABC transport system ATP-binding protein